jgi:hypothetical protein
MKLGVVNVVKKPYEGIQEGSPVQTVKVGFTSSIYLKSN